MAKLLCLTILLVFCFHPTSFSQVTSEKLEINIGILDSATTKELSIFVDIINLSGETKRILMPSRVGYVRGKIKAIGNFIMEVEKSEKGRGRFIPFPPTADINLVLGNEEYQEVKPKRHLMDTIYLSGHTFNPRGFPKGQYQLRVIFYWDEWTHSPKHVSKWLMFSID
ncbi:hypothetical protein V9K67_21830 [Paraflavisolibacter sp. H34]|uniref:hypothetical protein n=1 Tax=Huijunlia imazamoxiresistens TaxID=3127457 RepID=UPI003015C504